MTRLAKNLPIAGNSCIIFFPAAFAAFHSGEKAIVTNFGKISSAKHIEYYCPDLGTLYAKSWQIRPRQADAAQKGDSMSKKIIRNAIAKRLAVFAVSFFIMGGLVAITVVSPQRGVGAILHVPPFDITQTAPGQFSFVDAIKALTLSSHTQAAQGEQYQATFVSTAVPAAPPLHPHVDTLGFFYLEQIPLSYDLQRYIYDRSAALGLEFELVLALIWRESTFRIEAIGVNRNGTQDSGLMQINDVNRGWLSERYGIYNLMDPFQNVDAGTMILADLLSRYGEPYALMAYQFGEGGMLRMVGDGASATEHSRRVREKRYEFREMRARAFESLHYN